MLLLEYLFSDIDGDELTFSISSASPKMNPSITGAVLSINILEGASVEVNTVSITATDPSGESASNNSKCY